MEQQRLHQFKVLFSCLIVFLYIFRCPETEFDGCLEFEMNLPTVEYKLEGDLENLTRGTEAKLNSSGEKLDLVCSLVDSSFDTVTIEFDSDSSSVKFMSDSDNHMMDVIIIFLVILIF